MTPTPTATSTANYSILAGSENILFYFSLYDVTNKRPSHSGNFQPRDVCSREGKTSLVVI